MFTVCCGFPLNLAFRADVMLLHQPVNGSPAAANGFSNFLPKWGLNHKSDAFYALS